MGGAISSFIRGQYRDLDATKQRQDMEQSIGRSYKNTLKMDDLRFENLGDLTDSLSYTMNFSVKNEVHEIGNMKALKPTYPDVIATLDNFASDERNYPIEYWNYETIDEYDTQVIIKIPEGAGFIDIPSDEILTFNQLHYEIRYRKKSNQELEITRRFVNNRPQHIMPEEYAAFKSFFEKILKAEQRFIAFK